MNTVLLIVLALVVGFVAAWVLRPFIKKANPEI